MNRLGRLGDGTVGRAARPNGDCQCGMKNGTPDQPQNGPARKPDKASPTWRPKREMRVVDDQMQDVPRDAATMGEVIMRGNNVMKGYLA